MTKPRGRQLPGRGGGAAGVTLIELVIALTVIAIGATLLVALAGSAARSADPMIQAQSRAVAAAYLDEIMLRPYEGECGAERGTYDAVWCYDGLQEPPHDQFGEPIAGLADYAVAVAVDDGPAGTAHIRVTVSHPSGVAAYTLEGLRAAQ